MKLIMKHRVDDRVYKFYKMMDGSVLVMLSIRKQKAERLPFIHSSEQSE